MHVDLNRESPTARKVARPDELQKTAEVILGQRSGLLGNVVHAFPLELCQGCQVTSLLETVGGM
jgi:hypothetical protein